MQRRLAVGQAGVRIRPLGGNRAGEIRITRFLRNQRVTPAEIFAAASARTHQLVAGRHILAIQDSTTLRADGDQKSLLMHPTIAVDAADGALLGLVHGEFLHRAGGRKEKRKTTAFDEKQSRRWLDGTQAAATLMEAAAQSVTVIADREGDIYEEFARRPAQVHLLIRAAQDRRLADGQSLFGCTADLPELGRMTVSLPSAPGRLAREARLVLRARAIEITCPWRPAAEKAKLAPRISLSLVEAIEIDAPANVPPAHWRLLTTHAVTNFEQARQITQFYRERWTIEQLFRVCKTKGFNIEAVNIEQEAPYKNLAAAILVAALAVLKLVRDRDGLARRPLSDVFDSDDHPAITAISASLEGKTARQKNPHPPRTLAFVAWVCARLGGWTGYYGKPGPVVMLSGMLRLQDMLLAWKIKNV